MMLQYGQYILYAIIALFLFGTMGLFAGVYLSSRKEKEAQAAEAAKPREDTVAEQIASQFREKETAKERIIYSKHGSITKVAATEAKSMFTFASSDADNNLTLESDLDIASNESFFEEGKTDKAD